MENTDLFREANFLPEAAHDVLADDTCSPLNKNQIQSSQRSSAQSKAQSRLIDACRGVNMTDIECLAATQCPRAQPPT